MNSFIGISALAQAAPLPIITKGDLALSSNSTASFTFYGFAIAISISLNLGGNSSLDASDNDDRTSPGNSKYTGPGLPYILNRTAFST